MNLFLKMSVERNLLGSNNPNQNKIFLLIIYLIGIISENKYHKLKNKSFIDKLRGSNIDVH